jgi:SAM-dependent methyltransferase
LNLGCGSQRIQNWINIDLYGNPDFRWDLENIPWPWEDNSIDFIVANHILEHLHNWWDCFLECVRVLKVGGMIEVHIPDESNIWSKSYRDHHSIIGLRSFHGTGRPDTVFLLRGGRNAWASEVEGTVPIEIIKYHRVPYNQYNWMRHFPFILDFCANHMVNFIWEQLILFRKFDPALCNKPDREAIHGK